MNKKPAMVWALGFFALAGIVIAHHEMWRDELQAWLLARDSGSFLAFLQNMRYEGAPPLWHTALFFLSACFPSPVSMQMFHLLLGTLWVFILCRYAPFPAWQKILLVFGYYVFYQYTVVSRNYSLGLLLLALACVFFKDREAHPWRLGTALALASLTSVHALLVAVGIGCAALEGPTLQKRIAFYLCVAGALLAVTLMRPPADAIFPSAPGWIVRFRPGRLMEILQLWAKAFLPVPIAGPHFWENPAIAYLPGFRYGGAVAGLLVFACGALVCSGTTASRTTYLTGSVLLSAFFYCKYIGYSRHHGFLFFNFLYALWISGLPGTAKTGFSRSRIYRGAVQRIPLYLGVLLMLQCVGTCIAGYEDIRRPFSYGKEAASYLVRTDQVRLVISSGPDYVGVSVFGYLQRPFYSPQGDRWQTFTRWDRARLEALDEREFIRRTQRQAIARKTRALLLLDHPLESSIGKEEGASFLKSFTGSILMTEDYYLYRLP